MAEVEEECAACSALSGAVAAFYADGDSDEEEDSLVIEIHHVGEDEELSNVVCHSSSVSDIPVKEAEAVYFRRISPYDGDAFEKQRYEHYPYDYSMIAYAASLGYCLL